MDYFTFGTNLLFTRLGVDVGGVWKRWLLSIYNLVRYNHLEKGKRKVKVQGHVLTVGLSV